MVRPPHTSNTDLRRAEQLLSSADSKARWDGAELLGEFAETAPDAVWPLIVRFGSSDDADVRTAIATCVLEHVFQYHFDRYFSEAERRVRAGNKPFANTVSSSWVRRDRARGKQRKI